MGAGIVRFSAAEVERAFKQAVNKAVTNAVRRELYAAKGSAIEGYRSRGVLRRIFGSKPVGLRKLVQRLRVQARADSIYTGLAAKGLAGLAEQGARTMPHAIPRAFGRPGSVTHPGGPIAQNPQIARAVKAATPKIAAAIDKDLRAASARLEQALAALVSR